MYRVTISADFDTEEEARAGMSSMFDAAHKTNGSVEAYDIEDLDTMESIESV